MSSSPSAIEYHELRRADLASFDDVMLQGLGELERTTGLDQVAITQFRVLHRVPIWALFTFLRAMGRPPIRIFVGVDQNRVLGTASLVLLQKAGYILGVATDSSARGRGIATALLERLSLEAQGKGRPWVALDVESENETALRVYRRLGFEERARFSWYVGPSTAPSIDSSGNVTVVPRSQIREVAAWVDRNLSPAIREPLPATPRRFSHLELMARAPGSSVKTWQLSSSNKTRAVVRGFYVPIVRTCYALPVACDPTLSGESLLALVASAVSWARPLGAARTVATVPDPAGELESVMATLGLRRAVSTALMVRPSGTSPSSDHGAPGAGSILLPGTPNRAAR
jgi:GNAT superfamily N-acetyltransferase